MPRSLLLSTAILAGAFALSCGDPQSPMPPTDLPTPSLRPERTTEDIGFFDSDGRRTISYGITFEDLVSLCTGGGFTFDQVEVLIVTRPDGSQKRTIQGDAVNVIVWDAVGHPCELLELPHFAGTVRFHATDNDFDLSGQGVNSTGQTARGTVTDESGRLWRLVVVARYTVPKGSTLDDFVLVSRAAKIQLTPIDR